MKFSLMSSSLTTHRRSLAAQGGALVNLIHGYADNGDPFVRKFTDQLLEEVFGHHASDAIPCNILV